MGGRRGGDPTSGMGDRGARRDRRGRPVERCAPTVCSASPPTIVYSHGGGFVSGSSSTTRVFGPRLSAHTGAVVILVDYRLLPEHPFPAPLDDVIAVARAARRMAGGKGLFLGRGFERAALTVGATIALP